MLGATDGLKVGGLHVRRHERHAGLGDVVTKVSTDSIAGCHDVGRHLVHAGAVGIDLDLGRLRQEVGSHARRDVRADGGHGDAAETGFLHGGAHTVVAAREHRSSGRVLSLAHVVSGQLVGVRLPLEHVTLHVLQRDAGLGLTGLGHAPHADVAALHSQHLVGRVSRLHHRVGGEVAVLVLGLARLAHLHELVGRLAQGGHGLLQLGERLAVPALVEVHRVAVALLASLLPREDGLAVHVPVSVDSDVVRVQLVRRQVAVEVVLAAQQLVPEIGALHLLGSHAFAGFHLVLLGVALLVLVPLAHLLPGRLAGLFLLLPLRAVSARGHDTGGHLLHGGDPSEVRRVR